MNDDPSTSERPAHRSEASTATSNASNPTGTAAHNTSADPALVKKNLQLHKLRFLDTLIRDVDILIYAQLSALYYMDCSLTHFALRAFPHWLYFTPKPFIFPPPPVNRPYIGIVFGTNIICFLLHLLLAPPKAGEATRGYLHGGMVIDFVGQASPVSRWRLLGSDLLVWALQVVILCLTLKKRTSVTVDGSTVEAESATEVATRGQNHDAEERGVMRTEHGDDAIELRNLEHVENQRANANEERERNALLPSDAANGMSLQHLLDSFYTGEHVVANLRILDTLRAQWQASSVHRSPNSPGSRVASVNSMAGRILTYRFQRGM